MKVYVKFLLNYIAKIQFWHFLSKKACLIFWVEHESKMSISNGQALLQTHRGVELLGPGYALSQCHQVVELLGPCQTLLQHYKSRNSFVELDQVNIFGFGFKSS